MRIFVSGDVGVDNKTSKQTNRQDVRMKVLPMNVLPNASPSLRPCLVLLR